MGAADRALDRVAKLREVAACLRSGVAGDAGVWFAGRLEWYLAEARNGLTLDQAVELKPGAGERPWHVLFDEERRDQAVREFVLRFPNIDHGQEIRSYERRFWPRDRAAQLMPAAHVGTPREMLFKALRANESVAPGRMPSSESYLARVLATHSHNEGKGRHETPSFRGDADMAQGGPTNLEDVDASTAKNSITSQRRRRRGRA